MLMQRYAEVLSIAAVVCCLAASGARAQSLSTEAERIQLLRAQIRTAEEQHQGAAEAGGLWLRLANRYQDQFDVAEAEDAFARSLHLLRGTGMQTEYADALAGLGSVYLVTGRLSEAKNSLRKSLAIYQTLSDRVHAAQLHNTIALVLLSERRYRESEAESSEALRDLQSLASPDVREVVAAYLTHSYAVCYQGRCTAALDDANRAMAVVQARLPAESLEMAAVRLVRGFDQWRAGSPEEGEHAIREALRIARELKDLPRPALVNAQLGMLRHTQRC